MGSKLIVQMDGKLTRLLKPVKISASGRPADTSSIGDSNEFTFDYSYWSFDQRSTNFITQNQVYDDLGTDVINCAFQGTTIPTYTYYYLLVAHTVYIHSVVL